MDVTVTITPLGTGPCPGNGNGGDDPEVYFWEGLSGDFTDSSNWEPEGVPGQDDLAVFDKDQSYSVSFGDEQTGRAWVERGNVSFSGGSYTLGGGSQEAPSLVVGNEAADTANLQLDFGHQLDTAFAVLGRQANNEGRVVVAGLLGPPARWDNQARLTIGHAGKGEVVTEPGARLMSGELILGALADSRGELQVLSGGDENTPSAAFGSTAIGVGGLGEAHVNNSAIRSGQTVFGVEAAGNGFAFITNGSWDAERFVLGRAGGGIMSVSEGGAVSTPGDSLDNINVMAEEANSYGALFLTDPTTLAVLPILTVGQQGEAEIVIDNQAILVTDMMLLGAENEGKGSITVKGGGGLNATLLDVGLVSVGAGGAGPNMLRIETDSTAFMNDLRVGSAPGDGLDNIVSVDAGELTVTGALDIGNREGTSGGLLILRNNAKVRTGALTVTAASTVHGAGVITIDEEQTALLTGTIEPGIIIETTAKSLKQEGIAFGRGRGFDTLTIIGDVFCDGSVIVMDIGGDTQGLQDRLIIDGDGDFDDVTIKLNFKYRFAPQAGMTIPLIEVTGDGSVIPAALEFTGLEPGFDFDIEIPGDGSVIQMRALTDGIPTSFRAEDLNEDGQVNAVDVQLVINGALGLLDPLETDVNFDKVTNAVDVQLVINAALGL